MNIAFIVPLYKGKKYIDNIIEMINDNIAYYVRRINDDINVELIFINDFPNEELNIVNDKINKNLYVYMYNNRENLGIHATRAKGVDIAKSEYIVFLDQDDYIMKNFIYTQVLSIEDGDIVVGNAIDECVDSQRQWFTNYRKQLMCKYKYSYLNIGNMIRSPGQCLIKKEAIPIEWKQNIIKNNGADDLLLWLMMLGEKKVFRCNRQIVYIHKYSGENLSLQYDKMRKSEEELFEISRKVHNVSSRDVEKYLRLSEFRYVYKVEKSKAKQVICMLKYLDKVIANALYRIII